MNPQRFCRLCGEPLSLEEIELEREICDLCYANAEQEDSDWEEEEWEEEDDD